ITMGAGRDTMLVGVGGGVVTDIAGYVAAVYMRGISFGFVPTSILAMTDAAIGGKNGVDVGVYKNMVGTIRQPDFIFYDYSFLKTLPVSEWVNGFAEVIKHACIKDAVLFSMLERYTLHEYQSDPTLVAELIERNVDIKASVVSADEFEAGERKLLNFGHTIGHAIENLHHIPHGHAVSIGMVAACNLSEQLGHLHFEEAARIVRLLARYHLPVDVDTDHARVFEVLKMDKKRKDDAMQFILLNKIGSASVVSIPLTELEKHFKEIL
ncbi:MAG TPA: 3-dehydroquinate synthase, partial [Ferruginibacter sp.]|nr:3-dehydroquinate synthase [Ferruginibacter sp.]